MRAFASYTYNVRCDIALSYVASSLSSVVERQESSEKMANVDWDAAIQEQEKKVKTFI